MSPSAPENREINIIASYVIGRDIGLIYYV